MRKCHVPGDAPAQQLQIILSESGCVLACPDLPCLVSKHLSFMQITQACSDRVGKITQQSKQVESRLASLTLEQREASVQLQVHLSHFCCPPCASLPAGPMALLELPACH